MDPTRFSDGDQQPFSTPAAARLAPQRGRFREELPAPLVMPNVEDGRVRFRSKPGHRHVIIPLFVPHVHPDSPEYEQSYKGYRRWITREEKRGRITPKDYETHKKDKLLDIEMAVIELTGSYYIRFRPVAARHECVFETSEPVLADYIRWRINRGDFTNLYEETRDFELVVNGQTIHLRPSSLADQAVLANYFAALSKGEEANVELAEAMGR